MYDNDGIMDEKYESENDEMEIDENNFNNLVKAREKRITTKCDNLHPTCQKCEYLNNREICGLPKYFNNELDINKISLHCGKYKKSSKESK